MKDRRYEIYCNELAQLKTVPLEGLLTIARENRIDLHDLSEPTEIANHIAQVNAERKTS